MKINGMFVRAAMAAAIVLAPRIAEARMLTTVYSFTGGDGGTEPGSGVIDVGGLLYGTTIAGGTSGFGIVFGLDPATGTATVLHSFAGAPADGAYAAAGLTEYGGLLYGTTELGGKSRPNRPQGNGVAFSIDPGTGAESIFDFRRSEQPAVPVSGLVNHGGILFGTSFEGGAHNYGTLFRVNASRGHFAYSIYAFGNAAGGTRPFGGLLEHDGLLYGTTNDGGIHHRGVMFSFDPATATETLLYEFGSQPHDAGKPRASLVFHGDSIYGATPKGGAFNLGAVFEYNFVSGTESVLHSFAGGSDGSTPNGGLLYRNGKLYGVTEFGGTANKGTVFSVTIDTQAEVILGSFGEHAKDGIDPEGSLIFVNGSFYGTTFAGGSTGAGTVFQLQQ